MCSLRYNGFPGAAEVGRTESRKIALSCHEIGKLVLELLFKLNQGGLVSIGLSGLLCRPLEHFLDGFRQPPCHPHLLHSSASENELQVLRL
jgi:hypothetical protein